VLANGTHRSRDFFGGQSPNLAQSLVISSAGFSCLALYPEGVPTASSNRSLLSLTGASSLCGSCSSAACAHNSIQRSFFSCINPEILYVRFRLRFCGSISAHITILIKSS